MLRKPVLLVMISLASLTVACKLTSQTASRPEQLPANAPAITKISGEEIYQSMGCAECHNQAAGIVAPSLQGLYGEMVSLEGGETVRADEVYLRESILAPMAKIVSGYNPVMPDFRQRITDEQVEALIEYIKALSK